MIVELRTYQTKSTMRDRFLQLFERLSMPEHARLGMPIVGPLLVTDDPNRFFFMRGFSTLADRDELKDKFYNGLLWKEQLEVKVLPMLERYDVVVVDDPNGLLTPAFANAEEQAP